MTVIGEPAAPTRRGALAALRTVAVLGGSAAVGGALAEAPAVAVVATGGLPVIQPGDDWSAVLAATPQVQLQPGASYALGASVELPSGCFIAGNGATVTVADDSTGAFTVAGKNAVTLTDIRFLGRAASPINTAPSFAHVGIAISRSTDVRVVDCDFAYWRGAGITVTGSASDDYFAYRVKLENNAFHECYFGVSTADRSEYSMLIGNSFSYCRLAIWNSSGNWTIGTNSIVGCYGAYYSIAQTSPYGALSSDNWSHGSVTGNTFNHSNGGARQLWNTNTAFPIGGVSQDPGHGVVIDGLLPPTFTGNTLWYTDVSAVNLAGTRWQLSGCTFSNLTISGTGGVPVELAGIQSNGAGSAPMLSGNVKDLFAALY